MVVSKMHDAGCRNNLRTNQLGDTLVPKVAPKLHNAASVMQQLATRGTNP